MEGEPAGGYHGGQAGRRIPWRASRQEDIVKGKAAEEGMQDRDVPRYD